MITSPGQGSHAVASSFWIGAQKVQAAQACASSPSSGDPHRIIAPWRSDTGKLLTRVKLMVSARRRPDLSIEAFHDYWLNQHGPLTVRLAPTLRIQRYVQNHAFDSDAARMFLGGRDAEQASFDGLAEGWWRSEQDMIDAFSSPEGQEASRLLAEDERRFCTGDNMVLVAYEYEFVAGSSVSVD